MKQLDQWCEAAPLVTAPIHSLDTGAHALSSFALQRPTATQHSHHTRLFLDLT
jgi:hypothetical protein